MAKRRRKRRKVAVAKKSSLPRQESILHAIRCSNDIDWLKEVSLVSRDRYSKACALKLERDHAETWEYLRTYCKPGTWIVATKLRDDTVGLPAPNTELLQVYRHKLREKAVICKDIKGRTQQFDRDQALRYGVVALASLPEAEREPYEALLFEAGLEKVGHAFDAS